MATSRPGFAPTTGAADIEKEAQKARADFSLTRPTILKWDGDPSRHIIRLLDDDKRGPNDDRPNLWRGVKRHQFPRTTDKPKSFKGKNWPPGMPTTCRYDPGFDGYFKDCFPCDEKLQTPDGRDAGAKMRVYARAVLRERVLWTGDEPEFTEGTDEYEAHDDKWRRRKKGKLRAIRDMTKDVPVLDDDGKPVAGKTQTVPMVVLIDQSHYLFFQHLVTIAQNRMEDLGGEENYTVLDRDFNVTKTGKENKTTFGFEALPGSDELVGEAGQTVEINGDLVDLEGVPWDLRNPEVLAYYEQFIPWDVNERLIDEAMDEHVSKWLKKGGWDEFADDDVDDDEDEEDDDKPARTARKSTSAKKPAQKRGPQVVDEEEDDDEEPEDDDGPLTARKAAMRETMKASEKPARKRRDSSPKEEEVDDEDDEEETEDEDAEEFEAV